MAQIWQDRRFHFASGFAMGATRILSSATNGAQPDPLARGVRPVSRFEQTIRAEVQCDKCQITPADFFRLAEVLAGEPTLSDASVLVVPLVGGA